MIRRQRPFCVPFLNYVDPVKTQSTCRKVTVVTEEYVKGNKKLCYHRRAAMPVEIVSFAAQLCQHSRLKTLMCKNC